MGCFFGQDTVTGNSDDEVIDEPFNINEKAGRVTINDFYFEKVIGTGSFGKVMLVKKKFTNEIFAMKVLKKKMIERRNQRIHMKTERDVLAKVKCPFIVQLHYAFQTPEKLYFVMEFLQGGELFSHIRQARKFDEARTKFYAAEITIALEYLHKNNIIYRDLKPENVLLDNEGHLKITDLGLSKEGVAKGTSKTYSFCGTLEYLAPEIIKGEGHDKGVDWWSLGALIYEMLSGRPPFVNKDKQQMLKDITEKQVEMQPYFSDMAKSILTALLNRDPKKRLGSSERDGEEIRNHPFFSGIDWKGLEEKKIPAPFKPTVEGKEDVRNIDAQFIAQPINTPNPDKMSVEPKVAEVHYKDFTYVRHEMSINNENGVIQQRQITFSEALQ